MIIEPTCTIKDSMESQQPPQQGKLASRSISVPKLDELAQKISAIRENSDSKGPEHELDDLEFQVFLFYQTTTINKV